MSASRPSALALSVLFLGLALYCVLVELHGPGQPALDAYAYALPNAVHAARSFWSGGGGLLWNPYQAGGEPFMANPNVGMLYPPHLVFLVLSPNTALHLLLIASLVVGAAGFYLFARELGVSRVAAVGGAIVFQLGDPMVQLVSWSPVHCAPWTCVPWALLLCERLLRRATVRDAIALVVVLGVQWVAGFVLIAVLTCQVLALRAVWEIVTCWHAPPWRGALAVLASVVGGALLAAVHLVPAAELVGESARITGTVWIRSFNLTALQRQIAGRVPPAPFMAATLLLAPLALWVPGRRRVAVFFVAIALVAVVLALGPTTPAFGWYAQLPLMGATVRNHVRLFWVTGLCLAVLTAFGIETLRQTERRTFVVLLLALSGAALYFVTPGGLRPLERWVLAGIVIGAAMMPFAANLRPALLWGILALIGMNLIAVPLRWPGDLRWSSPMVDYGDAFARITPPITAQDRTMLEPGVTQIVQGSIGQKTHSLIGLKGIFDYDALLTQRSTRYTGYMLEASNRGQHQFFDLAALRILAGSPGMTRGKAIGAQPQPAPHPDLEVYINPHAFPRARYVGRLEILPDADAVLARIGENRDDLSAVAFVEDGAPSGWIGEAGTTGAGLARFEVDDPEHLVIEVDASARGFLVLADQYFPGWRAQVNGTEMPIMRANYLFRAVEVPAGKSRVELRYLPPSLLAGVAISAATAMVLLLLAVVSYRRRT